MKKQIILSLLTLFSLFAGCQSTNKAEMEREEGSRVLVSNKNDMYHTENTNTRLTGWAIHLNKNMKYLTNK